MALGAIVGAALTTPTPLGSATYIDNVYVKPLAESVRITMAGPGAISAYAFTIDDPNVSTIVAAGSAVRYEHAIAGTLFAGFVSTFTYRTAFGGQGRQIDVTCVGNEAILDWLTTAVDLVFSNNGPGLSGPGEWSIAQAIVRILGNLTRPAGGIRYGWNGGTNGGDLANPVGLGGQTTDPTKSFTITAGSTLRAALQALSDACGSTSGGTAIAFEFTIDPWLGLRVFSRNVGSTVFAPTDAIDWTIIPAGPNVPADIHHTTDALGLVRMVQVYSTTGVLLATVTDGTGLLGPTAQLTSPINDATIAAILGRGYLTSHAGGRRGDVSLDERSDVTYAALLGRVTIGPNASIGTTTATAGDAQGVWLTYALDLAAFTGPAKYDAKFRYGGVAPSGANLIRSLTRTAVT